MREASEGVSVWRGRRVWFWIYWDSDANETSKRRCPPGSRGSESGDQGRAWYRDICWENVRALLSEITRGVPEDREDVLELSSGLVQHSDDSQRNEEGRAKEAQRGGGTGRKPTESGILEAT